VSLLGSTGTTIGPQACRAGTDLDGRENGIIEVQECSGHSGEFDHVDAEGFLGIGSGRPSLAFARHGTAIDHQVEHVLR
jgi:hypothetical protein